MSEKLLSPEEIACKLNIKPATVRSWLRSGRMKGFKAGQRVWRVREEDYLALINSANKPPCSKIVNRVEERSTLVVAEPEKPDDLNELDLIEDIKKLPEQGKIELKQIVKDMISADQISKQYQSVPAYLKVRRILGACKISLSDDIVAERDERL